MTSVPAFIAGEWREISGVEKSPVFNPSRGEVIAEVPLCTKEHVDEAVESAADAFPAWRDTPPVERARLFFRYRQLVEENFDRICESVSREHGKTLAEARGSALSRHRKHRIRVRHSVVAHGRHARESRARRRLRDDASTARRLRRHHPLQFSGDGADVDVSARTRVRKYVRSQAERESSAHCDLNHRAARKSRLAERRVECSFTADANVSMRCSRIRK